MAQLYARRFETPIMVVISDISPILRAFAFRRRVENPPTPLDNSIPVRHHLQMPLHWTISHPTRLVLAVAKGVVRPNEVHRYFDAITSEGARPYRKMFNVTHMESAFDAETLQGFAAAVRANAANSPVGPIAIVARSTVGQQQAELFARAATVDRPLKIFVEEHEARRWLDEVAPAGTIPI